MALPNRCIIQKYVNEIIGFPGAQCHLRFTCNLVTSRKGAFSTSHFTIATSLSVSCSFSFRLLELSCLLRFHFTSRALFDINKSRSAFNMRAGVCSCVIKTASFAVARHSSRFMRSINRTRRRDLRTVDFNGLTVTVCILKPI